MRKSSDTNVLNVDDTGTSHFRRERVIYFEDDMSGYYQHIIDLIVGEDKIKALPPYIQMKEVDGYPYEDYNDENKGKKGVLTLHDEYLETGNKTTYFVVDSDYDVFIEAMESSHIKSERLHILDVYSIENFHVFKSLAINLLKNRCKYSEITEGRTIDDFLEYEYWQENVVKVFREILPTFLAIHNRNHKVGQHIGFIRASIANISIPDLFEISGKDISLKQVEFDKIYEPEIKACAICKGTLGDYEKKVKKLSTEDIMYLIPGKLLLNLFTHYLFDKTSELSGERKCKMECNSCPPSRSSKCKKLRYKNHQTDFMLITSKEIIKNPMFENTIKFIKKAEH